MAERTVVAGGYPGRHRRDRRQADQVQAPRVTLPGTSDDSGGPLVDQDGRVVGIVEGAATGPTLRNVIVAIDIAEAKALLEAQKSPEPPVAPRVAAGNPDFNPADLYERCVKSTAFIVTPTKKGVVMGSGSLIDAERRLVLTNYHVVDENQSVYVQFPVRTKDGSLMTDKGKYMERIPAGLAIKGRILHRDKTRDLALVQLEKLPPDTPALPLAKRSVRVGERVMNIGNAGRVETTFNTTEGSVRGVGIADIVVGGGDEVLRIKAKMVTVSNPVAPGDSGGPIIDRRGTRWR